MPSKPVAVVADVGTEPGPDASPPTGWAPDGSWAQTALVVETRAHLTTGGAPAAWKATAVFVYTGTKNETGATAPSPPVQVELTGSSDPLNAGAALLRDGDRASDPLYGNAIVVSASGPLASS